MEIQNALRARGKIWYHSLHPVFEELEKRNISYAILKGEPLSFYIYNTFGERLSNDIDILVDKSDLNNVNEILTMCGFTQYIEIDKKLSRAELISTIMNSHQTVSYKKIIMPYNFILEVDINFSIMWGEYKGQKINICEFLSHSIDMEIFGEKTKVLPPAYSFVQVLLHHYKDCNSIFLLYTRDNYMEKLFKELYLFWKKQSKNISLEWLTEFAESNHITEYIFYMLYYLNELYPDLEIERYVNSLKTDKGIFLLNRYGLDDSERKEWKYSFLERIKAEKTSLLIENQLTIQDREKIRFNCKFF